MPSLPVLRRHPFPNTTVSVMTRPTFRLVRSIWFVLTCSLFIGACDAPDGTDEAPNAGVSSSAETPGREPPLDTEQLLAPGVTGESDLFIGARAVLVDHDQELIVAVDPQNVSIQSVDYSGRLVGSFPIPRGEGPGELSGLKGVSLAGGEVAAFDGRNRVLVFNRDGEPTSFMVLDQVYQDVVLSTSEMYMIPGSAGTAFDRYDRTGNLQVSVGDREDLPEPCTTNPCTGGRSFCIGCQSFIVQDTLLLVVNTDDTALALLSIESGKPLLRADLKSEIPLLRTWAAQDEEALSVPIPDSPTGARAIVFKPYILSVSPLDDGTLRVLVSVMPSNAVFREEQRYEAWILDLDGGIDVERRLTYDEPHVGRAVAIDGNRIFAVHGSSGGIHVARMNGS